MGVLSFPQASLGGRLAPPTSGPGQYNSADMGGPRLNGETLKFYPPFYVLCRLAGNCQQSSSDGGNVIPFPGRKKEKEGEACPPGNDCIKRQSALMGLHFQIDAQTALEHVRGVYDYELTAKKLAWNTAAADWNATCGPLGYPLIKPEWFYELGSRKL